jgi:hypothetical protein
MQPLTIIDLTVSLCFPRIAFCSRVVGAWLSLVERSVRDREVGGSNPLAPTKNLLSINYFTVVNVNSPFSWCGQFVDKIFESEINMN